MDRLDRLLTELGEQSVHDASSHCTRCGYCEQACPTYVETGRETFSGRGRNQLVRALVEDKLEDPQAAQEALSTCLLCGACTTACPGRVPTADLVLEGRRMLRGGKPSWAARILTGLIAGDRERFAKLLKWAYTLQGFGLARLAAASGILRLLGLRPLEEASRHVENGPEKFLFEHLREDPELKGGGALKWAYFATCGSNYLFPNVGLATVKVLKKLAGPGVFLDNGCCGLACYNYGSLEDARTLAMRNIKALESSGIPESAPIVGDCSSCVAFLKSYPQLFLEENDWRRRAESFSARVRDSLQLIPAGSVPAGKLGAVTYHDSCRARNGQGLSSEPRALARAAAGEGFRELPEAADCCGGAGAFAFSHPRLSDALLRRKIANIASTHATTVAASSTSCLIQLARGLKNYYPECRVVHVSELVSEVLDG